MISLATLECTGRRWTRGLSPSGLRSTSATDSISSLPRFQTPPSTFLFICFVLFCLFYFILYYIIILFYFIRLGIITPTILPIPCQRYSLSFPSLIHFIYYYFRFAVIICSSIADPATNPPSRPALMYPLFPSCILFFVSFPLLFLSHLFLNI